MVFHSAEIIFCSKWWRRDSILISKEIDRQLSQLCFWILVLFYWLFLTFWYRVLFSALYHFYFQMQNYYPFTWRNYVFYFSSLWIIFQYLMHMLNFTFVSRWWKIWLHSFSNIYEELFISLMSVNLILFLSTSCD